MKKIVLLAAAVIVASTTAFTQSKEAKTRYKEYEKEKYNVNNTSKFWKNDPDWQMCKIALHFKNISTESKMAKGDGVGQFTVQSWAVLDGVSEEAMQEITNEFTEMFKKRMKEEVGIDVATWEAIKNHPNSEKMKEKAREDNVIFNKKAGAAYTCTADNGPDFKHVITFIPGGKKLSKEIEKNVAELELILDFAIFAQNLNVAVGQSYVEGNYRITPYTVKSGSKLFPMVYIRQTIAQQADAFGEGFLITSKFSAHDKNGYYTGWSQRAPANVSEADYKIVSYENYAESVENSDEIPQSISDRFKVKASEYYMHVVKTTDELYKKAALDALSKYLDDFIWMAKYNKCDATGEYCDGL